MGGRGNMWDKSGEILVSVLNQDALIHLFTFLATRRGLFYAAGDGYCIKPMS